MTKKLTNDEYQIRAKENKNITVLGEYSTMKTRILVRCNNCGREYMSLPQVVLNGGGCCKCRGEKIGKSKLEPFNDLKERIELLHNNIEVMYEESVGDDHKGRRWRKVRCRCKACGHEWSKAKDYLLVGVGCPECYNKDKVVDNKTFIDKMCILHPEIEVLEPYKSYHDKVHLKCKIDGYEWEAEPAKLFRTDKDGATGCPLCGGKLQLTQDEFCSRVRKLNPNIEVLNNYKSVKSIIKCRCKDCGAEWDARASNLIYSRQYCHSCQQNRSKGEMKIYSYLKNHMIDFEEQKTFEDCKDKRRLPFDFYIKDANMCIEYDGNQHFELTPHFCNLDKRSPTKQLEYYQLHDRIKNEYCKTNNITLIRISYNDYKNIEQILNNALFV